MLTELELGKISQAVEMLDGNVAAVCRETGFDRRTIAKYINCRFQRVHTQRKRSKKLIVRRKLLVKLAKERVRKGSRVWPKYSSASQLRAALHRTTGELLSKRQIQRELRSAGLRSFVRTQVPTRTSLDLAKRKAFAKKLRSWTKAQRESIVFSDESWLTCCEHTSRSMWAESRDEVLPVERKCRWNVPSVMVFAAVGINYKSPLIILPSKRTVDDEIRPFRLNSKDYIRRCLAPIAPDILQQGRIFQQDGARSHASKETNAYLRRKGLNFIDFWPPYSPDLNAIERIWAELQAKVGARCPMTLEELITVAKEEWALLPQSIINAHCRHLETQIHSM